MVRDNRETGHNRGRHDEEFLETPEPEPQADGVSAPPEETMPSAQSGMGSGEATRGAQRGAGAGTAEQDLSDAAARLDEQRDKYLRLAAEFDNYRKRTTRERQEAGVRAQGDLLKRILDSLDDLDRATSSRTEGVDAKTIVEGIRAIDQKLMRTLADAGLQVVNPVDEPFNPELHEAIATERALSPEDDHLVAKVYQPGYVFQGQLLRPARVVVKQWSE
ncbi:MAG TPA: nucleotide exchange factor GrpE [Gemmatimonadaceae bacterium]|nr:nucleotide exchange factor GrpE [Gemmatimonadaceae bacterium]